MARFNGACSRRPQAPIAVPIMAATFPTLAFA